jgi:hypothetical protein
MLATENATRLLTRVTQIAQATGEALCAAEALEGEPRGARAGVGAGGSAGHPAVPVAGGADWLPGIVASLRRIQLECADLHFALRELREALPSPHTLQPRLLD